MLINRESDRWHHDVTEHPDFRESDQNESEEEDDEDEDSSPEKKRPSNTKTKPSPKAAAIQQRNQSRQERTPISGNWSILSLCKHKVCMRF
jgi:hypothetical protein